MSWRKKLMKLIARDYTLYRSYMNDAQLSNGGPSQQSRFSVAHWKNS